MQSLARNRVARTRAVALLASGEYQVLQVDAPSVPAAEMRIAAGGRAPRPGRAANRADARGEDGIDALVLEVQRCFDYFESTMSQPPVDAL